MNIAGIKPILAEDYISYDGQYIKEFGIEDLIECISDNLPEIIKRTFHRIKNSRIEYKRKESIKYVMLAAASNFCITGYLPQYIDIVVLNTIEVGMIMKITKIFEFDIPYKTLSLITLSIIEPKMKPHVKKNIFSNLSNYIPIIGQFINGSFVNRSSIALKTLALGKAYTSLMIKMYNDEYTIDDFNSEYGKTKIQKDLTKMFNDNLNKGKHLFNNKEITTENNDEILKNIIYDMYINGLTDNEYTINDLKKNIHEYLRKLVQYIDELTDNEYTINDLKNNINEYLRKMVLYIDGLTDKEYTINNLKKNIHKKFKKILENY